METFKGQLTEAFGNAAFVFVTALLIYERPSEVKSWADALWSPGLQAVLMFLASLGFQGKPIQRLMGRKDTF